MRILIKGGVWKNTEDEILKAAVMKYGKNQWARISSLLVRKSAKQCKARWYEWLDPSIKKTEWSKEEDEKLLHLAKLMPTQWRTIAPIVGRTPAQCLDRYHKLLDDAEQKEEHLTGDVGPSADDVRKLRPGEIDPDPETKPARPDPIDMDEDEKEMLSEARARLANTQGKKAKRKAREKQLEEARRLASLQKRRELKAAGIILRERRNRRGMDYNEEIPFYKKPAKGFFDTTEERNRAISPLKTNISLQKLEGKTRDEKEEEERKKDAKKRKRNTLPPMMMQMNNLSDPNQISKRKKLMLPEPQVSDNELHQIVKIGYNEEIAKSAVADENESSKNLLSESKTPLRSVTPLRTPRISGSEDSIQIEARNLRALSSMQTPLLGEEGVDIDTTQGTGFDGATPRRTVFSTPRNIDGATPGRSTPADHSTSFEHASPLRTPYRDQLNINVHEDEIEDLAPEEQRTALSRQKLLMGLKSLPQPKNDFEIVIPEMEDDEMVEVAEVSEKGTAATIEDEERKEKLRLETLREKELLELKRRSQVVQRNLDRPDKVSDTIYLTSVQATATHGNAEEMIAKEVLKMLKHDSQKYPLNRSGKSKENVALEFIEDSSLEKSRLLIQEEMEKMKLGENFMKEGGLGSVFAEERRKLCERFHFLGAHVIDKVMVESNEEETSMLVSNTEVQFSNNRNYVAQQAGVAAKLEKKLSVILGGYQARSQKLQHKIQQDYNRLVEAQIQLSSFQFLYEQEQRSIPSRIEILKKDIATLEAREAELQARYQNLLTEKQELVVASVDMEM